MPDDWRVDEVQRTVLLKVLSVGKLVPKLDSELGITYPDADEVTGSRAASEAVIKSLVSQGALIPEVHDRVAACPKCGSPRAIVRERCPYCGSQLIRKKEMVQHTKYGHSAVVDATGEETRCPVCGEGMSIGEFRVAGSWFRCDVCHENFDKPEVSYACLADGTEFTYRDAKLVDVHAYRLSAPVEAELRKSTEVVAPVAEILRARGYDVQAPGEVTGTSGVKHRFDIIASSGAEKVGVDVVRSASPLPAERVIPTIVKMLDAGLTSVILIAMPSLDAEARSLLSTYEVKLVEGSTPAEVTNALVKALFSAEGLAAKSLTSGA